MTSTVFSVGLGDNEKSSSRVIQAPGGNASNIFGANGVNGVTVGELATKVDAAATLSPLPPIDGTNGTNGANGANGTNGTNGSTGTNGTIGINGSNGSNGSTNGHYGLDSDFATPPSSASSSRRGSRQEDTKNRLFGPELESPRRRVVDRMKSNIFSEQEGGGGIVRSASVKRYDYVIRRNPITGEVYDEPKANGCNGNATLNGKMNGVANSGSASLPSTPVRVRQPPGGKSSGIF